MQDREITGKQLRDAIGRSGMTPEQAMDFLDLKRATYYAWRSDGVPMKDVPRIAARLSRWLYLETQPQAPLSTYSNLDLLTELTRRLAVLERIGDSENLPTREPEESGGANLSGTGDGAEGPTTITGRGPSPDLGGSHAVEDDQDYR